MEKSYQMSDLEHGAFLMWCKSSETYRIGYIQRGYLDEEPSGEMASEDWFRYHSEDIYRSFVGKNGKRYLVYDTKEVRVKGYDKNAKF